MSGVTRTYRPVLSRGQTIDVDCHSCCSQCSDDLVTVLEMVAKQEVVKRPFKVTDRLRQIRKGIVAKSLKDLIRKALDKLNYADGCEVYLVLEEDGTEVDDEEYFQSLPDNTRLMLLLDQDIWSTVGPAYSLHDVGYDEIQV
eukprot:TRINITY_DN5441_c0_g1_i1.p1 TRINITY_DN5441_c0_g1~~TRINITY_DN5441_c0_g1_i1.p1  ORF type:complete len:142 (-),score=41.00 TRINITY_DN5441_c0_g1_i1:60-485(-)